MSVGNFPNLPLGLISAGWQAFLGQFLPWVNSLISQINGALTNIAALQNIPGPWLVDIDVFDTPGSQTNWNTIALSNSDVYYGALQSSGAQNAQISWPVVLSAGTWTFSFIHQVNTNMGICTVNIDGTSVGTVDCYASTTYNVISTIMGIVATSGKHTLQIVMAGKNGSSSGYYGIIQHVRMIRTA